MSTSCFFQDNARSYDAKTDGGKIKRDSGRSTKDKRIPPGRINLSYRITMTIHIRTDGVVLLRHRINSRPGSRAVVEAGAEVGVGDAEGVLLLLAAEAPAVGGELGQAVGMTGAEWVIIVLLLDCAGGVDNGPHAPQMVRDVVVHGIAARARLADAPTAEGDALQGLRPVGEVCVVGFHGGSGLDLCRQVNQIVRRLQVVGGIVGDIAVDIVGIVVPTVTRVGVREGGRCAVVSEGVGFGRLAGLGPGPGGDVAGLLKNRRRPIAY